VTRIIRNCQSLPTPRRALCGQGQYDKAKIALEMAIRTHPSMATAMKIWGHLCKNASQAYDRALATGQKQHCHTNQLALIKDLFATPPRAANQQATRSAATEAPAHLPNGCGSGRSSSRRSCPTRCNVITPNPSSRLPILKKTVLQSVNEWAAACRPKTVKGYLAYTPLISRRQTVKAQRLGSRTHMTYQQAKIHSCGHQVAQCSLLMTTRHRNFSKQFYKSSTLNDSGNQKLMMVKSGDQWLIQEERSEK